MLTLVLPYPANAAILTYEQVIQQLNSLGYGDIASLDSSGNIVVSGTTVLGYFPPNSYPDNFGNGLAIYYFVTNNINITGNAVIKDTDTGSSLGTSYTGDPKGVYIEITGDFTIISGSTIAESLTDFASPVSNDLYDVKLMVEALLYILAFIVGRYAI